MTDNDTQNLQKEYKDIIVKKDENRKEYRDTAKLLEELERESDRLQDELKHKRYEICNLIVDGIKSQSVGKVLFFDRFDVPTYIKVTDVSYSVMEDRIYFYGYVFSANFETEFRDNHWYNFSEDGQIEMQHDIDKKCVEDYGFSIVYEETLKRVFNERTKQLKKAFKNAFDLK